MNILKNLLRKTIPPNQLIHLIALDHYWFGAPEIRHLRRLCLRNKHSIDVGANVGVYTYFLRKYSQHVHAYEPNPHLAENLSKIFPQSNVSVHAKALSNCDGKVVLKLPVYNGQEMHGLGSLAQDFEDAESVHDFDVTKTRLDDEGLENVGFLKVDVEQHEKEVLEGAMGLIEDQQPNILVEVTPLLYDVAMPEFFSAILRLGYDGFFLYENRVVRFEEYDINTHNVEINVGNQDKFVTNFYFIGKHGVS